jgi:hypothetical protein
MEEVDRIVTGALREGLAPVSADDAVPVVICHPRAIVLPPGDDSRLGWPQGVAGLHAHVCGARDDGGPSAKTGPDRRIAGARGTRETHGINGSCSGVLKSDPLVAEI